MYEWLEYKNIRNIRLFVSFVLNGFCGLGKPKFESFCH